MRGNVPLYPPGLTTLGQRQALRTDGGRCFEGAAQPWPRLPIACHIHLASPSEQSAGRFVRWRPDRCRRAAVPLGCWREFFAGGFVPPVDGHALTSSPEPGQGASEGGHRLWRGRAKQSARLPTLRRPKVKRDQSPPWSKSSLITRCTRLSALDSSSGSRRNR